MPPSAEARRVRTLSPDRAPGRPDREAPEGGGLATVIPCGRASTWLAAAAAGRRHRGRRPRLEPVVGAGGAFARRPGGRCCRRHAGHRIKGDTHGRGGLQPAARSGGDHGDGAAAPAPMARPTSSGTSAPTRWRARPGLRRPAATVAGELLLQGDANTAAAVGMTVEPAGGSTSPRPSPSWSSPWPRPPRLPDAHRGGDTPRRLGPASGEWGGRGGGSGRAATWAATASSTATSRRTVPRPGPVGDDVGEAELGSPAGHLGVEVGRLEREPRRGVEREVPGRRRPARRPPRRRSGPTSSATWSNHSSSVSPRPP